MVKKGNAVRGIALVILGWSLVLSGCPTEDTANPEVSGVTIEADSLNVERGETLRFSARVDGTGGHSEEVRWSVINNKSQDTKITSLTENTGELTVGENETAATLTVMATSTANEAKSAIVEVTVTVTNVAISPSSVEVAKGGTQQFSAAVNGTDKPSQSVSWSVEGKHSSNTSISASGLLRVGTNETAATLTVRATSTADSAISGMAEVRVTDPTPTVTSVAVSPSYIAVEKGVSQQFSAMVYGTGNPSPSVSWSVEGKNSSNTSISASGLLSVGTNETAWTLTVRATSTADSAISGTASVTVITITSVTIYPSSVVVAKGGTRQFNADVRGIGDPYDPSTIVSLYDQSLSWSVEGKNSSSTSISASGLLRVGTNETAGTLMVRATSTADSAISGTAEVRVPAPTPTDGMVSIPGGTFTMGSPDTEDGRDGDEGPRHSVTVSGFSMGRYEVTRAEYRAVMGRNPSHFSGDNLPVGLVSWYDAIAYCNALSIREGLTPAYTIDNRSDPNNTSSTDDLKWTVTWNREANGYRLPTEAEWEYACRAGTSTPYYTGNNITTSQANYEEYWGQEPTPVGSFAPNPWGLYDMHGNVAEWCWDWYGSYSSDSQTDPDGPSTGAGRVGRGGWWSHPVQYLRSANRGNGTPSGGDRLLGFRLVRSGS
jgi:formylglycine-generating enzyme required for sulfatase activity